MKQKQHVIALAVLVLLATLAVAALVGCGKTVEVTFDPANGAEPTVVTVGKGEVPAAPADPEREGYTFMGWYLDDAKYKIYIHGGERERHNRRPLGGEDAYRDL